VWPWDSTGQRSVNCSGYKNHFVLQLRPLFFLQYNKKYSTHLFPSYYFFFRFSRASDFKWLNQDGYFTKRKYLQGTTGYPRHWIFLSTAVAWGSLAAGKVNLVCVLFSSEEYQSRNVLPVRFLCAFLDTKANPVNK
jgi:hypothetical protein